MDWTNYNCDLPGSILLELLPKRSKKLMKSRLVAFLKIYIKGIKAGNFYEEPLGDDFIYPDW